MKALSKALAEKYEKDINVDLHDIMCKCAYGTSKIYNRKSNLSSMRTK